ncbi:MAG: hypothetical protein R2827_04685 [Bdellovibrionales bacterium]
MKLSILHLILFMAIGLAIGCDDKIKFSKGEAPGTKLVSDEDPPPIEDTPPVDQPPGEDPTPPVVPPTPPVEPPTEPPVTPPTPPVEPPSEPPVTPPTPPVEPPTEPPVTPPTPPVEPPSEPPSEDYTEYTESFEQEAKEGKVDILFVIDNSLSMRENQKRLAKRFNSFIADLHDVDWQLAFTTVDSYSDTDEPGRHGKIDFLDGADGKILTPQMSDPAGIFAKSVERDQLKQCHGDGSSQWSSPSRKKSGRIGCVTRNEEPIKSIVKAIGERNNANAGFFRDGADLAVVVVSDEDERSNGRSKLATPPEEVVSAVSNAWDGKKKVSGYGIIVEPGDRDCLRQNRRKDVSYYGTFVAHLAELTGGITGSICDTDYGESMRKIGENVKKVLLHQEFELMHEPIAGSLEVELVPHADIAWSLRNNVLVFEEKPPENTIINVKYRIPANGPPYAMNP